EKRNHLFFGQTFDLLRTDQCRIAAEIANLLRQPLKLLVLGGLIRQQIGRGLNLDCAYFLQSTPDRDALGVAIGWETIEKEEPRGRLHHLSRSVVKYILQIAFAVTLDRLFRMQES